MGVRVTDSTHVCLYDSVTDIAFGPVFYGPDADEDAELFLQWHLRHYGDPRQNATDCVEKYGEWLGLVRGDDDEIDRGKAALMVDEDAMQKETDEWRQAQVSESMRSQWEK